MVGKSVKHISLCLDSWGFQRETVLEKDLERRKKGPGSHGSFTELSTRKPWLHNSVSDSCPDGPEKLFARVGS